MSRQPCGLQEGDTYNMKWESQNGVPGLQDVYLNLMPRLFAINKGVPFMIQGSGQAGLVNWGDGFVTDPAAIKQYGLSDANNFFTALMRTEYLNQVCPAPPCLVPLCPAWPNSDLSCLTRSHPSTPHPPPTLHPLFHLHLPPATQMSSLVSMLCDTGGAGSSRVRSLSHADNKQDQRR